MTKKMIREAKQWEEKWIKAGRPRRGKRAVVSESMQVERPRVSARQRFNESYSGKTPNTRTVYAAFNAAYDAAQGKARWTR